MAPTDIQRMLSYFGLGDGIDGHSVRLGRGVVGRTTHAVIALLAVLGVVALRVDSSLLLWLAGMAVVAFGLYYAGTMWYGHRHPGEALLEGSELLRWQQAEMAAKGLGPMPPSILISNPTQDALEASPVNPQAQITDGSPS